MSTFERHTEFRPRTVAPGSEHPHGSEPRSLAEAIRVALQAIGEESLRWVACRDAGVAFEPRTILAMLSYCYAHRIYGSNEVEDAFRRDLAFRSFCGHEFPDARLLRRCRRENREALHATLAAALHFLAGAPGLRRVSDPVAEAAIAEEATRRIHNAMFIDNIELDGDS